MNKETKNKSHRELQPEQEIGPRVIEEVAALLENSITPFAKVEHNVRLPVIGKSRRRQCDVVITSGEQPRQTVTIVEVQKRQRKPDINTFHGWHRKMEEVGAQHLICVSMLGYPKSIIEEVATTYGPTVRLLTLAQIRETRVPGLEFVYPYLLCKHPHFTVEAVEPGAKLKRNPLENRPATLSLTFTANDKVFTLDNSHELQSLNELIAHDFNHINQMFLERRIKEPNSYSLEITLGSTERNLWLNLDGQQHKVLSLPVKLSVETTVYNIPLTILSYQQQFIDGVLAWVTISKSVIEDKEVSVQLVFRPDREGFLQLVSIKQQGIERVDLIVSTDKAVIEALIADDLSKAK
jgi:hypothetical protein